MAQKVSPRAQAVAAQLKAEISLSQTPYNSIPKVAAALGTEYTTYYRRVNGKMPLSMELLFATLDLIGVNEEEFWPRAIERMRATREH
jgi:hypothetical protein